MRIESLIAPLVPVLLSGVVTAAPQGAVGGEADSLEETVRRMSERMAELERSNQELEMSNRQLDDRVAELAQETGDDWLTEQRAEEIRGLVADVLADADTRASLLQSGVTAGYDGPAGVGAAGKGFFLQSADGSFRLSVGGYLMFRYVYNNRRDVPPGDDTSEYGFNINKARLWMRGHVFKDWQFFIRTNSTSSATKSLGEGQTANVEGITELDQFWVDYTFSEDLSVKAGLFSSPLHRENYTEPHNKLMMDNGVLATLMDTASFEGVEAAWRPTDHLLTYWIVSNGARSTNNTFDSFDNAEIALAHQTQVLLAGEWSQFNDFTSRPGSDFAALLSGSVYWEDGRQTSDGDGVRMLQLGGELGLEGDGWNVFARADYWHTTLKNPGDFVDDFGLGIQGGYYLLDNLELTARYNGFFADSARDDSGDFNTAALGLTFYPNTGPGYNNIKLNLELNYFFDPTDGSIVSPSNGTMLLASPSGGQWAIAGQLGFTF